MSLKKMKKSRKWLPCVLAMCILVLTILSGCSDDVVVLTPEEEAEWAKEQTNLFSDVQISDFEVQTIDGRTVTEDDCFKGYELTMINIWGTFCSPCIDEMPDIAKLYDSRPEGVNIISICTDAGERKSNLRFANDVMEKSAAHFDTLIPDKQLGQALTDRVTTFPTTIFVDSYGKIIGDPYFGDYSEEGYRKAIEERLQLQRDNNENEAKEQPNGKTD